MKSDLFIDVQTLIWMKKRCYRIVIAVTKGNSSNKVYLFCKEQIAKLESLRIQSRFWNDISRKEVICKLESVRYKLLTEF